jgi:pyruvate,water dikinase
MRRYVYPLENVPKRAAIGGKARGLLSLRRLGLAVPSTVVVIADAHADALRQGEAPVLGRVRRQLVPMLNAQAAYAVRSSWEGEDGHWQSMAGRFVTTLGVTAVDDVLAAIVRTWASERPAGVHVEREPRHGRMSVLVQEMVDARCAGVVFSRNPVTGGDEVVVEAVEGTAERLLRGEVTPMRWVSPEQPLEGWEWEAMPASVLEQLADIARRVAAELRYPADLEWAYDGARLWWLQVRPITSLRGLAVYSNRISKEYLPGLVKPLVWSINVPMINGAWVDLFERIVGPLSIDPLSLARRFHYRAYFNMSGMGQLFERMGLDDDTLEQMLGLVPTRGRAAVGFRWKMLPHLPRLLMFLLHLLLFRRRLPGWAERTMGRLDAARQQLETASGIGELTEWADTWLPLMREAASMRIVALMMHFAVGQMGSRAARRHGFEEADLERPDPSLEALDPQASLQRLSRQLAEAPDGVRHAASALSYDAFLGMDGAEPVRLEMQRFLDRFGHLSESGNDFSSPTWSDDPTALLKLLTAGSSAPPPPRSAARRLPRSVRRWARRVTRARRAREQAGAVFAHGFDLLRRWALRCGDALCSAGILVQREDVFLLERQELADFAFGEFEAAGLAERVRQRREAMASVASITLPETILGEDAPIEADALDSAAVLRGIATSRGVYEGAVRVVRGLEEFPNLREGDVVVVPYSDVAWTPLFARAGAIVAEAGGILSHSSIVAREFGIPAVVSVAHACDRLQDTRVRVDGYQGTVTVLDPAAGDEAASG